MSPTPYGMAAKLYQAYFSRQTFRSPVFLFVTPMALLTLVRALWIVIGFWSVLSIHGRVIGVCLLLTLPGPLVMAIRSTAKIGEKLRQLRDDELTGDLGLYFTMAPFFAYFAIFLSLEIAFLALRHM